jgi:hypothetical protein
VTEPDPVPTEPRRRFLRRLGTTIAAGIGLVAFGADGPAGAAHRRTNACTLYCRSVGCPTDGCGQGQYRYSCTDACDGTTFDYCITGSCTARCLSTVCP